MLAAMTGLRLARIASFALLLVSTVGFSACRRQYIDPVAALEPVEVVTGWFDDGVVEGGKNRLVPSITFRLRNASAEPVSNVQMNVIFRREGETASWGEHFGTAVPREDLAPGATTEPHVIRSTAGYTGEDPKKDLLENSQFMGARVEIFLRQGSQTWARLTELPIERRLLTQ
jgi:hypothetical protein